MRLKPAIAVTVLIALLVAVVAAPLSWYRGYLERPGPHADEAWFEVTAGSSLGRVAAGLAGTGVLAHPRAFVWYARYRGDAVRVKAGEYLIPAGATPQMVLDQIVAGRVYLHGITLVEGWTFAQVRTALGEAETIKQTLTGVDDAEIMAKLKRTGVHPEGQFLPDTYRYPRGTTDLELLATASAAMQARLADAWAARDEGLPLSDPYDALILASIVERETGLASERARVAGVFVRRLRKRMRLQTDPTVIYGLGDTFDGNLRKRDLQTDGPYNTYTRGGLPPTPIAMPGGAAIDAVLHPEEGEALYFVASGDGDGSHVFSATLKEHNAAVRRYIASQRGRDD